MIIFKLVPRCNHVWEQYYYYITNAVTQHRLRQQERKLILESNLNRLKIIPRIDKWQSNVSYVRHVRDDSWVLISSEFPIIKFTIYIARATYISLFPTSNGCWHAFMVDCDKNRSVRSCSWKKGSPFHCPEENQYTRAGSSSRRSFLRDSCTGVPCIPRVNSLSLFFLSEFSEVHVQYMVDMLAIRSRTWLASSTSSSFFTTIQ